MTIEFQYFSCVEGHVVPRYGTDVYIGVFRTKKGWDWNEDKVVPVPVYECARFRKEYLRAVKDGALKERTKADYEAYLKSLEQPKEKLDNAPADGAKNDDDNDASTTESVEKKGKSKKGGNQ